MWTITTRNMTKLQSFEMWASDDDENVAERKHMIEEVLEVADERLYMIPKIKERRNLHFGHVIRRNSIHMQCSGRSTCRENN